MTDGLWTVAGRPPQQIKEDVLSLSFRSVLKRWKRTREKCACGVGGGGGGREVGRGDH